MIISEIPDSVFARALELMNLPFTEREDWTAEKEYEYVTSTKGVTEGELEKAIFEHMTNEGWTQQQ